jgi:hypothetical protein
MKKLFTNSVFLAFISLFIVLTLTTCKKDKECKVVITVKYQGTTPSDTIQPVAGAHVHLYSKKSSDDFVRAEGESDAAGQFTHTYKLEAILDVLCTKDTDTVVGTTLQGEGVVRLKPGQTVYKTIFLN